MKKFLLSLALVAFAVFIFSALFPKVTAYPFLLLQDAAYKRREAEINARAEYSSQVLRLATQYVLDVGTRIDARIDGICDDEGYKGALFALAEDYRDRFNQLPQETAYVSVLRYVEATHWPPDTGFVTTHQEEYEMFVDEQGDTFVIFGGETYRLAYDKNGYVLIKEGE